VGATGSVDVASHVEVGGGLDLLDIRARHDRSASTESAPQYARSRVFAEFDTRTSPEYTRRGTLARVELSDYQQVNDGTLGFRRVDLNLQQYVPLLRENWVIALRALGSATTPADGNEVPFYLMPDLGGPSTLRGYSTWRFRDRNRLLFSGEWRWTAGPFVDMALFADAGSVASHVSDFDWHDMKHSYGVGISLHTFTTTVTRLELARTGDGMSVGVSFSPSF
jgi:outer membrane protein assembly factor BamA